ncbi:hypothetical protein [Bradyrhizobium sp. LB13.1]
MSKLKSLLVAALLALAIPSAAQAQGCGSPNPNCIVPTAPPGTSTNQAASTAFVQGAVTTAAPGGSVGQQQYKAGAATFGGFTQSGDVTVNTSTGVATIQPNAVTTSKILNGNVTNTKLAPGAANTLKGSLDGITTSDLAIASCSALYNFTQWVSGTGWQCGINPVLPSRAIAATLNLSAFTSITTLGYSDVRHVHQHVSLLRPVRRQLAYRVLRHSPPQSSACRSNLRRIEQHLYGLFQQHTGLRRHRQRLHLRRHPRLCAFRKRLWRREPRLYR